MSKELQAFDQLKSDISLFVSPVAQLVVTDFESGQKAIEAVKVIKNFRNQVEFKRKEVVAPLNQQVKLINSYAGDIDMPLERAENHIKAQLVAFEQAQERIRQQKQREEEQRRQEEERRAAAERARVEAEFQAKRQAELAALSTKEESADLFGIDDPVDVAAERKATEERLAREEIERQMQFERETKVREAEAKQRVYDLDATRLKGAKKNWKCEAIDLSKVPREFLIIQLNNAAVLAAARGGMTEIPGVRLWQETGLAIGATTSIKQLEKD